MTAFRTFIADSRGNVAIVFSLTFTILLLVAGLAADYAVAVHRKRSMDVALDSAVLSGARAAAEARMVGKADWRDVGKATASAMFRANLPGGTNYETLSFEPIIEVSGAEISATGSYS